MLKSKYLVALSLSVLFAWLAIVPAQAQSDESKFEVGGQFSALTGRSRYLIDDDSSIGGGGRFPFNPAKYITLEREMNYFPDAGYNDARQLPGQFEHKSDESKFEVGVQFSALTGRSRYLIDDDSSIGGGGRFSFNLTKYITLEGEMNYFPDAGYYDVRRLQGQFGLKSGVRFERVGFFGKIRPGFINTKYDIPVFCTQAPCPSFSVSDTNFSMDVGGVVELYPARRLTVRFDAGDTIMRRETGVVFPVDTRPSFGFFLPSYNQRMHHLQINAGVGFRF